MKYIKKRKFNTGGQIGAGVGAAATSMIPVVGPALAPIGGMIGGAIGKMFTPDKKIAKPIDNIGGINVGAKGGTLPLGKGAQKYFGPKHEQGGILVDEEGNPANENQAVAEVEGGETEQDGYIFSDELIVPETDMTFADAHEMLLAEGADESEIQELVALQEQVRESEGASEAPMGQTQDVNMIDEAGQFPMAKGGNLPKYNLGGLQRFNNAGQFPMAKGSEIPEMPDGGRLPHPAFRYQTPANRQKLQTGLSRGVAETMRTSAPNYTRSAASRALGATGAVAGRVTGRVAGRIAGPLGDLASPTEVGASHFYSNPQEAQAHLGLKPANRYTGEPMIYRNNEFNLNPINRNRNEPFQVVRNQSVPVTTPQAEVRNENQSVNTNRPRTSVLPTSANSSVTNTGTNRNTNRRNTRNQIQDLEQESNQSIKSIVDASKTESTKHSIPNTVSNSNSRGRQMVDNAMTTINNKETTVVNNKETNPNWRNLGIGLQVGTRLAGAMMPNTPKTPHVSYRPLKAVSPVFANERNRAGAGLNTAIKGGANAQGAYAQYLQAGSDTSAREAEFKRGVEGQNEQMRQETERTNVQITAQNNDMQAQERAAKFGLVASALDIPVTTLAADTAAKQGMLQNINVAASNISDPVARKEFIQNAVAMMEANPNKSIEEILKELKGN